LPSFLLVFVLLFVLLLFFLFFLSLSFSANFKHKIHHAIPYRTALFAATSSAFRLLGRFFFAFFIRPQINDRAAPFANCKSIFPDYPPSILSFIASVFSAFWAVASHLDQKVGWKRVKINFIRAHDSVSVALKLATAFYLNRSNSLL
jgi:hypothetical protein